MALQKLHIHFWLYFWSFIDSHQVALGKPLKEDGDRNIALTVLEFCLRNRDANLVLTCRYRAKGYDAIIDNVARAPVAERLPESVAMLLFAIDAIGTGVVLAEWLTAGSSGLISQHQRIVNIDVMPTPVVFFSVLVGTMIRGYHHELGVCHVLWNGERIGLSTLADSVGSGCRIVVEVAGNVFRLFHHNGNKHVGISFGKCGGVGFKGKGALKDIAASGTTFNFLIGSIGNAKYFKLHP